MKKNTQSKTLNLFKVVLFSLFLFLLSNSKTLAQCANTYNITITPCGYWDESTFQIRNSSNQVVFSTSGSGNFTYSASGTAPDVGPFTVVVETQGSFNDNCADWLVSTDNNGVVSSGSITGGQVTTSSPFCSATSPPTSSVLSGDASYCSGNSSNLTVTITGGSSPYTVVYNNGTSDITVTNYVSGANIPVSPTSTTTYTLVSVTDSFNLTGNGNSGTATVTVFPIPAFTAVTPICAGDTLPALPTTSNNGVTGSWSPAINNTATTTYTFTPASGNCPVSMIITVNPIITPTNVTASPSFILPGESSNISAISAGNNINWYTTPTGGTPIGTAVSGGNLSVSPTTTTTYYAEAAVIPNQTTVYNISIDDLVNVFSNCDGTGDNYYNSCNGSPAGFQWTDLGTVTPSNIQIDFIQGIECDGIGAAHNTTLNNGSEPSYTNTFSSCDCNPASKPLITINPSTANYIVGGNNVFMVSTINCIGFSRNQGLGQYFARVTVSYPTSGSTSSPVACANPVRPSVTVSVGAPITVSVQGTQCGSTLATIDQYIYANLVSGAQGYRFKVTDLSTNQVQTIDKALRVFQLTQLTNYKFNTTYSVEVAVRKFNVWYPFSGTTCTVTTPANTTQIRAIQCGSTLTAMSNVIYADNVPFATGYRFRVVNTLTSNTQVLDRTLREFRMNLLTSPEYNTLYTVEVAIRNTDGTYLPYGPICNLTTPEFPTTFLQNSQCDYTAVSNNETFYAVSYPGATTYRFRFINTALSYSYTFDKVLRTFNLSEVPGLQPATTYAVQVSIELNGEFGPYGKVCSLTTPGTVAITRTTEKVVPFTAVAYPNPYAESFNLNVTTSSDANITITVYDMIGKQIEVRQVSASAINTIQIGDSYPSGVYNLIVTQGETSQNIRVIKR